jgi:hypothetical protein
VCLAVPHLTGGVGSLVPIGFGQLDVGLTYRDTRGFASTIDHFRVASSYNLGLMTASAAASTTDTALGVSTTFLSAKVGTSFSREEIELPGKVIQDIETIRMEVGIVF